MAQRINVVDGDAVELNFPDGSVLRLRWDDGEQGVKITAEELNGRLAVAIAVLPRATNGIVLLVE